MPVDSVLPRRKLCFVTVGATAPFDELITACQTPEFISVLESEKYTNLLIQHGHKDQAFPSKQVGGIRVTGFDFRTDGIKRELMAAKGDVKKIRLGEQPLKGEVDKADGAKGSTVPGFDLGNGWRDAPWDEGVVISHAGSGSILEALRMNVLTIVVPNEKLLDNHQVELAEQLSEDGLVIHGQANDLIAAIKASETLRLNRKKWPPSIDSSVDPGGKGLIGVMDEEMGFRDLKG